MGRPSNTEQRRAQIVEALSRVLAQRGWAAATVHEIAAAAGLSPGLLHYHFASKKEILLALAETLGRTLRERYERRAERASDPRALLFALLDAHVARGEDSDPAAVASWAAIGAEAMHQEELRVVYARAVAEQTDAIEERLLEVLRAEGREVRGARRIAAALISAIEGAYRISSSAPGVLPEGFAAPTLRRVAEGLIGSQPIVEKPSTPASPARKNLDSSEAMRRVARGAESGVGPRTIQPFGVGGCVSPPRKARKRGRDR